MTHIQRRNGNVIDLDSIGIRTRDFIVSAPSYNHSTEYAEGLDGYVDMGSNLLPRNITVYFRIIAKDWVDFGMFRDEIFDLFRSKESFYLIEKRNPGKRWLVKVSSSYNIPQRGAMFGDFEIPFIANSGLSESIGTTLNPFEWDVDLWQWGMGIPYDDYSYEHTTNNFTIYNAGTETVNPRSPHMQLSIEIQANTSDYIELINNTTGDVYRYDGNLSINDTLVIDGIRSTRNGLSGFRDTNGKLITLAPGENDFEVKGAQVERILFDFRFYYL